MKNRVVGICLGASNVKIVIGEAAPQFKVVNTAVRPHDGNARRVLEQMVREYAREGDLLAVTGRKLKELVDLPALSEPEATEMAYAMIRDRYQPVDAIISAGGETFMVYELDRQGRIADVHTGNKCASGTGEFFLQQIRRMDLKAEEALGVAEIDHTYQVAGRCSVFCKSDCTHALNKGTPKGRVVAGLCRMMAGKVTELLKKANARRAMLVGGTAGNRVMVDFLRREGFEIIIPSEAPVFEALGAAIWGLDNGQLWTGPGQEIFKRNSSSFNFLDPLANHAGKVSFKETLFGEARPDEEYILGLDVGSTTTKAVLIGLEDEKIVANIYLRTNGDPVGASRQCYDAIAGQVPAGIKIVGLGVTGSGRQIAGLHALTDGVINEIIAHATAAVHFDPEVDTIFEIGGQDAKYTYITNRVPSDYAMNEACSAGTGSFLEEAARESLDIGTLEIGDRAVTGSKPPNFNDQCAAFISSDIKTAIQEGIPTEDIAAGLVYSICLNYINRVKGSRAVGRKVFMQGGVCYNRAVPVAMAAITGNEIIVPPEPGLMGAFGVALEIKHKLELGILKKHFFDIRELAVREVEYGEPFVCAGGKEKCDRKCQIARVKVNGKIYPFGGACNRYYNERFKVVNDPGSLDYVARRTEVIFGREFRPPKSAGRTIGITPSLLTNYLYPFYHEYFTALGFEIVMAREVDEEGIERRGAAFCHPVALGHGFMASLLALQPDYIFLPQVKGLPVKNGIHASITCPFVQGEPYYLSVAFRQELEQFKVLKPVLDMGKSFEEAGKALIALADDLGVSRRAAREAFDQAVAAQEEALRRIKALGAEALTELERDPSRIAIVVFGRPYNAFAGIANMGIPHKFASRGLLVIPHDALPFEDNEPAAKMYWSTGQGILKAARFVKEHPQIFGAFITSFSCGPDSFIVSYFRDIMGEKPSLTLELDAHTADAGVDTRVEAFLDVIKSYLEADITAPLDAGGYQPAAMVQEGEVWRVRTSTGELLPLEDRRVHLLLPSMGDGAARALAASFRFVGVRADAMKPPREEELKRGKANASCKECLPLMLTVGSLLNYLDQRPADEVTVYFMPEADGPCRFGQYNVLISTLIKKQRLRDVAQLTLTSENGYAGLNEAFVRRAWVASVIADVMEEIYAAVLALAADRDEALVVYRKALERLLESIATDTWDNLQKVIAEAATWLKAIKLSRTYDEATKVALIGEIYVRRDAFSRQYIVEKLADKGVIAFTAPVTEWIYYSDYLVRTSVTSRPGLGDKFKLMVKNVFMVRYERMIKDLFAACGIYHPHLIDIDGLVKKGSRFVNPALTGETILTVSSALTEIIDRVDGVISIGPFGCMPSRIAEAIITQVISTDKPQMTEKPALVEEILRRHPRLPFLSIESDGNAFPPVIEARLESFVLQANRVHASITDVTAGKLAHGGKGRNRGK